MIEKLYKLKKSQTDQILMKKAQVMSSISTLDDEITDTQYTINTTSVDKYGAISDFAKLQIHKNTMANHIVKLENKKRVLKAKLEQVIKEVIELQKETEQFSYLLEEEKKEAMRKVLVAEEEASSEYMQSKYIRG